MSADLFQEQEELSIRPLADRMRPQSLDEVYGQRHLLAPGKPLYLAIQEGKLHSMVLWGPPGTGKTTLARLIAQHCKAHFISLSAVLAGVKEIRAAIDEAKQFRQLQQQRTVLFVDEVHRFNKAQQDAFLPHIEDGTITFIGATTENPSFELNNALLSRVRVYVLKSLTPEDLHEVMNRSIADSSRGLADLKVELDKDIAHQLITAADGDARRLLNLLEIATDLSHSVADKHIIDKQVLGNVLTHSLRRFDKQGDYFYDQISALHKSVRGSSPDAALYWLVRMFDGGCDPVYIARRVVRMASEDIGNADMNALNLALNAWDVQERLGSPEGELAIAQAVVYLACAPKSNAVYMALHAAREDVAKHGTAEVPNHLRNAPTKLLKSLGHGHDYRYAHDEAYAYAAGEHYFPESMTDRRYYEPTEYGLEKKIRERLQFLRDLDKKARQNNSRVNTNPEPEGQP